jgi:hypothetical protein
MPFSRSVFVSANPTTGMVTRGKLEVEDLLKLVLILVIAYLALEIVGLFIDILASIAPVIAIVIVVLIVAYFLDYI